MSDELNDQISVVIDRTEVYGKKLTNVVGFQCTVDLNDTEVFYRSRPWSMYLESGTLKVALEQGPVLGNIHPDASPRLTEKYPNLREAFRIFALLRYQGFVTANLSEGERMRLGPVPVVSPSVKRVDIWYGIYGISADMEKNQVVLKQKLSYNCTDLSDPMELMVAENGQMVLWPADKTKPPSRQVSNLNLWFLADDKWKKRGLPVADAMHDILLNALVNAGLKTSPLTTSNKVSPTGIEETLVCAKKQDNQIFHDGQILVDEKKGEVYKIAFTYNNKMYVSKLEEVDPTKLKLFGQSKFAEKPK